MGDELLIGSTVKTIGYWAGLEGVVTKIIEGHDIEDHGMVEIKITRINKNSKESYSYLNIGDLEHFVYFEWENTLKVLY